MACRILVVEDDAAIQEFLDVLLRFEGYAVELAHNGQDALDLLEQSPADIVLLDFWMPVMDGPACLAQIRARKIPTRVVLMSGIPDMTSQAAILPIDGILVKPFDLDAVLAVVQAHCPDH
jgi:DNA-binding response OmpR family regulator